MYHHFFMTFIWLTVVCSLQHNCTKVAYMFFVCINWKKELAAVCFFPAYCWLSIQFVCIFHVFVFDIVSENYSIKQLCSNETFQAPNNAVHSPWALATVPPWMTTHSVQVTTAPWLLERQSTSRVMRQVDISPSVSRAKQIILWKPCVKSLSLVINTYVRIRYFIHFGELAYK